MKTNMYSGCMCTCVHYFELWRKPIVELIGRYKYTSSCNNGITYIHEYSHLSSEKALCGYT